MGEPLGRFCVGEFQRPRPVDGGVELDRGGSLLNLPAKVEMATPNTYADQFEWFRAAHI